MLTVSDESESVDKYGFIGGDQYTSFEIEDVKKVRRRESKWLDVLNNWDFYVTKKFDKLRKKCRKGIPEALRARVWQHLCGSRQMIFKQPDKYKEFLSLEGNPQVLDQIARDVGRQFPYHEMFASSSKTATMSQNSLSNVLRVYSIMEPTTGYCQAQAPVAAALLTQMPEEEAFWTAWSVWRYYLPGYFDVGLEKVQLDAKILYALLKKYLPQAHRHLVKLEVEPVYFMVDWFMCLFTRNFPWATVLRILDMFFCEGIKVIFRVAMAMVKAVAGTSEQRQKYNTTESIVSFLRNLPPEVTHPDFVVVESLKFANIPPSEFIYQHLKQYRQSHVFDNSDTDSSAPIPAVNRTNDNNNVVAAAAAAKGTPLNRPHGSVHNSAGSVSTSTMAGEDHHHYRQYHQQQHKKQKEQQQQQQQSQQQQSQHQQPQQPDNYSSSEYVTHSV